MFYPDYLYAQSLFYTLSTNILSIRFYQPYNVYCLSTWKQELRFHSLIYWNLNHLSLLLSTHKYYFCTINHILDVLNSGSYCSYLLFPVPSYPLLFLKSLSQHPLFLPNPWNHYFLFSCFLSTSAYSNVSFSLCFYQTYWYCISV